MILALPTVLMSGCATIKANSFCDIAETIKFADREVIDHLMVHDRKLVVGVTSHNEKIKELCP